MNTRKRFTTLMALGALSLGCVAALAMTGGALARAADGPTNETPDPSVQFTDCVETIGVGLVPTAGARAYVPAPFVLAGEGQPVTPLVVRTARCGGISVDGGRAKPGEVVQIGAVVVPPDGTGDINNYTVWYYTSDAKLATRLRMAGVEAQHVPTIDYDYDPAGGHALNVRVPRPGAPRLWLSGTVAPSPAPAGSFTANWWQKTDDGNVKMQTVVPVIQIGGADLTLTTSQHSALAQLVGGETTGFPIIQQFNTFTGAQMNVSTSAP